MPKRFYSIEELKKYLQERNTKLVCLVTPEGEQEFEEVPSTKQKVKWLCGTCSRPQVSGLSTIIDAKKEVVECRSCGIKRGRAKSSVIPGAKLVTYTTFCEVLEERGWKMLSESHEYQSTKSKMEVVCSEGHPTITTYNRFTSGGCGCKECDIGNRRAKSITEIREEFADKGFKLLEEQYISYSSPIRYLCKCGKESTTTYSNFRKMIHGCKECVVSSQRKDYDEVVAVFSDEGCELLTMREDYKSNQQELDYICSCGSTGKTSLKLFRKGIRCSNCTVERRIATNLERYGVEHSLQSEEIKQKAKETWMRKYGVDHNMKSDVVQAKMMETNKRNHGGKHNFSIQTKEERAKMEVSRKNTMMKRYGVLSPPQHPPFLKKQQASAFSTKPFTFPSGKVEQVQGHEPFALRDLLQDYDEDDLVVGCDSVPCIKYFFEGRTRVYYPDIYIPSENMLIEVKSAYTITLEPEKIQAKIDACCAQGYTVRLMVYDNKGELLEDIVTWYS